MANTNDSAVLVPSAREPVLRYLHCLRPQDVLVLQGTPLLGAVFAMRHPQTQDLAPLLTLVAANLFLVAHIFMLNDWSGVATDLTDRTRAAGAFTARGVGRREMGALTAGLLLLGLVLFSRLGLAALGLASAIALLSALYSLPRFNWKGRPLLNSATHLVGGVLHFLLGYSLGSAIDHRGVAIALFFALIFAAGHLTQEVRDHPGDAANGIRTNAVAFGPRRTFAASLALFALAHVLLLGLVLQGFLPRSLAAVVAFLPVQLYWSVETFDEGLTYAAVCRLQVRYRWLYAIVGLVMAAVLYATR